MRRRRPKRPSAAKAKIRQTLHEYRTGRLHSGSKRGPKVKSRKQAVAIALAQGRRARRGLED